MKRSEVLRHAPAEIDLTYSVTESQSQKATDCTIPSVGDVQKRQSSRERRSISGCQGAEKGKMGVTTDSSVCGIFTGVMEMF